MPLVLFFKFVLSWSTQYSKINSIVLFDILKIFRFDVIFDSGHATFEDSSRDSVLAWEDLRFDSRFDLSVREFKIRFEIRFGSFKILRFDS